MKYKRLAIFIENKSGTVYQVAIKQNEMDMVADLLMQIQGGTIKVAKGTYPELIFTNQIK